MSNVRIPLTDVEWFDLCDAAEVEPCVTLRAARMGDIVVASLISEAPDRSPQVVAFAKFERGTFAWAEIRERTYPEDLIHLLPAAVAARLTLARRNV